MTILYLMNEDEFPNGLRCIDCSTTILPGMAYTSRPDGVFLDGSLLEELICIPCSAKL